jgi:hypothetical protein
MHLNETELDQIATTIKRLNAELLLSEFDVDINLTDADEQPVGAIGLNIEGDDGKYAFFASIHLAS